MSAKQLWYESARVNILGINCFSHDTAAALVHDGVPVAFVEEERFNREKHTKAFPDRAIEFCLHQAGIGIREVDAVAFSHRTGLDFRRVADTDEDPRLVHDRYAGDVVAGHQLERVADQGTRLQGDRLHDHARLRALHLVDLRDLILDREVAVDDADASLPRERDRQARLRDRVHGGGDDRDLERDRPRQARRRRDVVGKDCRLRRQQRSNWASSRSLSP